MHVQADIQEFSLLKDHNTIYKLIGPALVPQDQTEAKSNVEKRLEFIRSEMYVSLLPKGGG
jgi:prefoldin beta subunit